jgi:predicted aspartyl protease
MIVGSVDADGIPFITLAVAGQNWRTIVDSGFNGDLELPDVLRTFVNPEYCGQTESILAGGQCVLEDAYEIAFPFDGEIVLAETTFVVGNEILLGTGMLQQYRLEINFRAKTVLLERLP